jgi:hypothetical protein
LNSSISSVDDQISGGEDKSLIDNSNPHIQASTVLHLVTLYNKAIEYYSAMNDERHIHFLQKLQVLLQDEKMQKMLEKID